MSIVNNACIVSLRILQYNKQRMYWIMFMPSVCMLYFRKLIRVRAPVPYLSWWFWRRPRPPADLLRLCYMASQCRGRQIFSDPQLDGKVRERVVSEGLIMWSAPSSTVCRILTPSRQFWKPERHRSFLLSAITMELVGLSLFHKKFAVRSWPLTPSPT